MATNVKSYRVIPTEKLTSLFLALGGSYAASKAWGLEYNSIRRFMDGDGGISANSVAAILERTGLDYRELFKHEQVNLEDLAALKKAKPERPAN